LVTCSHVVGHRLASGVTVSHPWSGQTWRAETVAVDPRADLALLWMCAAENNNADRPLAYVELADTDPRPGEAVFAAGYGHAGVLRAASGNILATGQAICCSIRVESGDSGGGLFNDRGQLCAVIHGCDGSLQTADYVEGTSYATASSALANLVAGWQTQCGPNGCPIPPRRDNHAGQRMKPLAPPGAQATQPPPGAQAIQPPPKLAPIAPPAGLDPALLARLAAALAKLDKLATDVDELKNRPPLAGPRGEAGPAGPSGPKGDPGPAGSMMDLKSLPPITVQILDEQGAVRQETQAHLGGAPLRIQLVPK
jgi:hypothetical protein